MLAEPGTLGVVIGGSGNGEQIAANKVPGVRAALVWNRDTARLAREHNDANVVAIGARMHSVDDACNLVSLFLATSAQDLAEVRQLAKDHRWSELGRAAHRLKGSSGAVGAVRVQELCVAIEEQTRSDRPQDVRPLVARLEAELERARAALGAMAAS